MHNTFLASVVAEATEDVLQRMVVTLTDSGNGRTMMEVESHFSEREGMEAYVEGGYEQGSRETIEKLEELLANSLTSV